MKTVCFFGHRSVADVEKTTKAVEIITENLIANENVSTFLFGSKSKFNEICYDVVTEKMKRYPHIRRVFVRAEFKDINEEYTEYLLSRYEETYYTPNAEKSGKAVYVKRNFEMIDKSDFCVVYFDKDYSPEKRKSGTKIAYDYAEKKKKNIINVFEQ